MKVQSALGKEQELRANEACLNLTEILFARWCTANYICTLAKVTNDRKATRLK